MKYKVMLRDNISPVAKEILEETGAIEVVIDNDKTTADPEVLAGIIGDFDGIAIRSTTSVTAEVIEKAHKLKVIGRAGIGVDNIDRKVATKRGIVVMNAPGGNTITTAEHAVSMMLSSARNIPQATASLKSGKWEKKRFSGVEITGKTLGIIGLGQIGRVVAERAKGLRMRVTAADPFVSEEAAEALGVELLSLEDLLACADFITLHVPRLKDTMNLINREAIAKMKPGVRLINCSRGEVVDLDALYEALESGHVKGAALDVFPEEPPPADLPILTCDNAVFTPHLGASTGEAQVNVARMVARQMAAYLTTGTIVNAVNFPSIPRDVMDRLQPYLNLAEKLGSMMGQLLTANHDVDIHYSGYIGKFDTRPLTHAVLKGILGSFSDEPVNWVNAPALAQERGIKVSEITTDSEGDFAGLIKVKIRDFTEGPSEIWGTVYEKAYPRIVRMGNIYMDAVPEGPMIVIQNIDRPGVIGHVGTTLGRHNINIGRFQLGRSENRAICLVSIDTPADEVVLTEIMSMKEILSAKQVFLDGR
jgi:D-3-phosphoglycerate dehydrogenase